MSQILGNTFRQSLLPTFGLRLSIHLTSLEYSRITNICHILYAANLSYYIANVDKILLELFHFSTKSHFIIKTCSSTLMAEF